MIKGQSYDYKGVNATKGNKSPGHEGKRVNASKVKKARGQEGKLFNKLYVIPKSVRNNC